MTKLYLNSKLISDKAREAKGFFERFAGLIGRKNIEEGFFLLFRKCNSIHTFFMSADIDVIMTDAEGVVRCVKEGVKPWRTVVCLKASDTVEAKAGSARGYGIKEGDKIKFS